VSAEAVRDALSKVYDPELHRPITDLGMLRRVGVTDGVASVELVLTIVGCPAADRIEADVRTAIADVAGVDRLDLTIGVMTPAERDALTARLRAARPNPFGADSLTRVIAVSSGKGGVGKSTVTAGLAVALAARGLQVGLMDADVFGFSIPGLLGIPTAKPTQVGELILPPEAHGIRVISIGMFVDDGAAVSWRGPLLHRTMQQFLTDVYWGDLDVLVIDLPPGTGDVAISLGQLLPQAEVIVVTTPQPAAAVVAERSGIVARQTGQRVIGVIENMSGVVQSNGTVLELFGSGGGATVSERLGVPLLGSVPLSMQLRADGDAGSPAVLAHPDDPAAAVLLGIADALVVRPTSLAGTSLPLDPR